MFLRKGESADQCQSILFSEISGVQVALDASSIQEITMGESTSGGQREPGPRVPMYDIAEVLGLQRPPETATRRAVLLPGPEGQVKLLLGTAIALEVIKTKDLMPLPSIVEEACQSYGCIGLLQDEDGFRFVLDPVAFIHRIIRGASSEQ